MEKAAAPLRVDTDGGDAVFSVRVVPGASSDKVCGISEGCLRVRVAAPPHDGRANRRLLKYLSKALVISGGKLEIASGEKARSKKIRVKNVDKALIEKKLARLCRDSKKE